MKNLIYCIFFCIFFSLQQLQGSWTIVQIKNETDLSLVQAIRNHDIEISSISQIFKYSDQDSLIKIPSDALFGTSGGCKIIAQNAQNQQFAFSFFGDFTHRVANGRSQFADLDSRKAATFIKQSMMARVFQTHNGVMKLIGFTGFDQSDPKFKLVLKGAASLYEAQLIPVS